MRIMSKIIQALNDDDEPEEMMGLIDVEDNEALEEQDLTSLQEEAKRLQEERLAKLMALGSTIAKKRDEAVQARAQSGIEEDWIEDEEFYEGIDDANRDLYRSRGNLSPETQEQTKPKSTRSKVFLNITRPYVDAAAAKVADMLLPTDDQNWGIEPTPIPTLTKNKNDTSPLNTPDGQPVMTTDNNGQPVQATVADHVKMIEGKAKDASKLAEKRIDDWLTEANYNHETRKVIEQCSRLGTGVIKGPYPALKKSSALSKEGGLTSIQRILKISPESRAISPWDLYPDPACGNDIHSGSYIFEKDRLTKRKVEELLDDNSYITEMLEKCLLEGPQKKYMDDNRERDLADEGKDQFDIWYYTGYITKEDLEAAGCPCHEDARSISAIVVMINDHVVKAAINPIESGDFFYDVMPWQERDNHWAGIGVARQIRTPQRILNSAVRNLMDNAGLMSGPQIVMRRNVVTPADGVWELSPRKFWWINEDAVGTVNEAFSAVNIPAMQQELFSITQFAIKMAEDVTGLPMLLQGQQGKAPETVGGMQMLNNNASTVMRRIARTYDDKVTEPHIRRYYEWLLLDQDVPDEEKGDYQIVARGSSALVERDIQNQSIAAMGAMVANPAFGIDPKKWFAEYSKSQRLDPRTFQYTEDELKAMQEQMASQPQPQDPNQIRAEASMQVAQIRSSADLQKAQLNQQSDMSELQFKAQEAERERQHDREMKQLDYQMKMMEFAEKRNISLEQLKGDLAKTAMTEKNKRELQGAEIAVKQNMGTGL